MTVAGLGSQTWRVEDPVLALARRYDWATHADVGRSHATRARNFRYLHPKGFEGP
jgi:hypothetical protein